MPKCVSLTEKIQSFPKTPGVYWMKDANGEVLYVGKAKDLRDRVKAYFRKEGKGRYQIDFLMQRTAKIDYCTTRNEQEALLLEEKLIKKHKPRYNLSLRDDKTYPSLKLNLRHPFPGLFVTRRLAKDGSLYFGPFVSATSLRQSVDWLTKHFKLRTCSDHEFANRSRPCLEYSIGRCSAPCVGKVFQETYAAQIGEAKLFLEGRKKELTRIVKEKMKTASGDQNYEEAARLRDILFALKETLTGEKAARVEAKRKDPMGDKLLSDLQRRLRLVLKPAVIECVDISNFQGKEAVGALVCFKDGKPFKNRYRKFKIRLTEGPNDYAMMSEVLSRRFKRALGAESETEKIKWELPDLLLVDGGKGHLNIAKKILADLGLHTLAVAAIAKAKKGEVADKIYIPGRKNPLSFLKNSPELLLLMRIRDEAHRFGITYHRKLRARHLSGF